MAEGFWLSDMGISIRLEDLSQLITSRTFNNALQMYAPETGLKNFSYTTMRDGRVCDLCSPFEGNVYRAGQFMPILPRHIGCRCLYDVYFNVETVKHGVEALDG